MDLKQLLRANEEQRNQKWELDFLNLFPSSQLGLLFDEAKPGPDGWPYLMVSTDEGNEPAYKVIQWASDKGVGIAVNPQKELPDYVFTFGMLWNFTEHSSFINNATGNPSANFELSAQQNIISGPPTEEYLPIRIRKLLKEFWLQQRIYKPKILVLSADQSNYDLCFSTESLNSPPDSEHQGIAEAMAWFLPNHYNIVLVSEKNLPSFYEL